MKRAFFWLLGWLIILGFIIYFLWWDAQQSPSCVSEPALGITCEEPAVEDRYPGM